MKIKQNSKAFSNGYIKCPYGITYDSEHLVIENKDEVFEREKGTVVTVAYYSCIMYCKFAVKEHSRMCEYVQCECKIHTNLIGVDRGCI